MFPLLCLPKNAVQRVLRELDIVDLISISLCSAKTKSLAKSIDWKVDRFRVDVDEAYHVTLYKTKGLPTKLSLHKNEAKFKAQFSHRSIKHNKPAGDWIRHLASVTGHPHFGELSIKTDKIPADSIKETLKGLEWDTLSINYKLQSKNRMNTIELLWPKTTLVSFGSTFGRTNKFMMSRNQCLIVPNARKMRFDDLLMANATVLQLQHVPFSGNELNLFIKLLMKGSNPQLKCAYFSQRGVSDWNEDTVLDGIPCETMTEAKIMNRYNFHEGKFQKKICQDGIEVKGFRATVFFKKEHRDNFIEIVINDR